MKLDVTLKDLLRRESKSLYELVAMLASLSVQVSTGIADKSGIAGTLNIYGEKQLAVDVWSNDLFVKHLKQSGLVKYVASEELGTVVENHEGEYSVVLDPLDGSSNLESDNLVGTIVGVYDNRLLPAKGRELLASMYFLYGPYLELVLALRDGVRTFFAVGKGKGSARFLSSGEKQKLPSPPKVYGIGGPRIKWVRQVRQFVETLENRALSLRYGGSFVGDYSQVLSKGGFFAYPQLSDAPRGKYRLQFESNPIAFITEKAGGSATTGMGPILDIEPASLSERVPTYLGNAELVHEFESLYANNH
jgi:fructose-1,6-bisphosphatase I